MDDIIAIVLLLSIIPITYVVVNFVKGAMIKLFYGIDEPMFDPKLGFLDNIARWKALTIAAQMKKDDPEFGKAVEKAKKAHKRMDERLRKKGLIK